MTSDKYIISLQAAASEYSCYQTINVFNGQMLALGSKVCILCILQPGRNTTDQPLLFFNLIQW
jgi:hypothetical protein